MGHLVSTFTTEDGRVLHACMLCGVHATQRNGLLRKRCQAEEGRVPHGQLSLLRCGIHLQKGKRYLKAITGTEGSVAVDNARVRPCWNMARFPSVHVRQKWSTVEDDPADIGCCCCGFTHTKHRGLTDRSMPHMNEVL
eukprot:2778277-Amphidinium_carterae.4